MLRLLLLLVTTLLPSIGSATEPQPQAITLNDIHYAVLGGNRVAIDLELSAPISEPSSFLVYEPARIALDLPGVRLNLPRKRWPIQAGAAHSVTAVHAEGRTRVIIDLIRAVPYQIQVTNSVIRITLAGWVVSGARASLRPGRIEGIDFVPTRAGEGRVLVTLSVPTTAVQIRQHGSRFIVQLMATTLPDHLERRLDVGDFPTPVRTVEAFGQGHDVQIVVDTWGALEQTTYQSERLLTLAFKPTFQ